MKTLPATALLLMITSVFAEPVTTSTKEENAFFEKIRSENSLPALGGLAIVDGKVEAIDAVGLRKHKGKEAVTINDKWHIGSCTKAMTATLAATFIEEGKLKWESTIGEVFGGKTKMLDEYKDVTLKTLLTNRSGIPGGAPLPILRKAAADSGKRDIAKRRKEFVEELLKMKPDFRPGTEYAYSNSGFVVAGAMLEAVSGKSWEDLMRERIFKSLKMESAGFGGAASRNKEDQPWGHHPNLIPQPPGPGDDNPDVIGPAGTVHCSLMDLGRYVKMHLGHEVGPVLKKPETFKLLQTIAEGNKDYACGWVVFDRPWANGPALWHNGSNTMNYCVIWMAPNRKFATISVANADSKSSNNACDAVATYFMGKYLGDAKAKEMDTKVSPFSGVRWEEDEPVVKIGSEWFRLVSLNGIAAGKIVGFCKREHSSKWKQRFAEDLVEVLAGMGKTLTDKVKLEVKSLGSSETKTLEDVSMTKENRDAIRSGRTGQ